MATPDLTVTFDFYGTLVQWRETLRDAIHVLLQRHGADVAAAPEVVHAFEQRGRLLRATPPFRPFAEVLELSLQAAMRQRRLLSTSTDIAYLLHRLSHVPAQPEAPAVLAALRPLARLVIISNTDDDLLTPCLAALGTPWDAVVTSEQARAYKPDPALFRSAQRRLELRPDRHLHVAESAYADLSVCQHLELPAVWINRQQRQLRAELRPLATLPDLRGLPALIQTHFQ